MSLKEILKKKTYLLLILLGIFITFTPPVDPDFGWHYKYGEFIVQQKQIPKENLFSYTFPEYEWANSYWISQVLFFGAYSTLGTIASGIVFSFVLSYLTILALEKAIGTKKNQKVRIEVLIGAIILFIFYDQFKVPCRPLLFSTIFMLFLVYSIKTKRNNILFTPILFLLWTNMHADFTLGLAILGIFNIQLLLTKGIKRELLPIYAASLLSLLITLMNPYGIDLWKTLFKETNPTQFWHIGEWLPINSDVTPVHYYVVSAFIIASLIEMENKKELAWLIITTAIFFVASIRSAYFIRIFLLLGIFPLMDLLEQNIKGIDGILRKENFKRIKKAASYVSLVVIIAASIKFVGRISYGADPKKWAIKNNYPYEAIKYIKKTDEENSLVFSGRMFNHYTFGGYLIWKLPEHKTFIDGRMPSWREGDHSIFEDYIKITKEPEKNYPLLVNYGIDWIFVPSDSQLTKYLEQNKKDEWSTLFQNDTAIILKSNRKSYKQ